MGATAYLFNDYIKDLAAASITVVNENTSYPKTNMQDEQIALTTRTTNKTNIKIQFTLASSKAIKAIFIGNHNFNGGSLKIYTYTAADFSTGQNLEATVSYRALDMYTRITSPNTRQYWEIDLSANGSITSADSFYEWGRIMLYDDLVQFTSKEDWLTPRGYGFRNIINETKYGVRWIHKLSEKQERFELTWNERKSSDSLHTELRTLYDDTYGGAHPIFYIPDISGTPCYYCYIEEPELLWSEIMGTGASSHIGDFHLRFIEAVRGKA